MSARIGAAAVLTLVVLLFAELGARTAFFVRDRMRGPDSRVHADALAAAPWRDRYFQELDAAARAEWRPYVAWRSRPFHGEFINLDERGRRRTWNPPACGPDSRLPTILMFGGSTMWGVGARDDFTIPSAVAHALASEPGQPFCVVNLGELGYVTSQELIALITELRAGTRPRLVVFYDGDNDAFAAFQEGMAGAPQNEAHRREEFNLATRPGAMALLSLENLVRHTGLYRAFEAVGERMSGDGELGSSGHVDVALARAVVDAYASNLRIVETLGAEYDFQTLFYWQPLVFDKRHLTPSEAADASRAAAFGQFWRLVEDAVKADPALARDHHFHDVATVFAGTAAPLFIDFAHVSEEGSAIVAARLTPDVKTALESQ
jgi:hypothetical protein